LEKARIVKQTRVVGKSKMYKLNKENPVVRKLIELDAKISEMFAQEFPKLSVEVKSKK
jgi:hypothetical protein